MMRTMQSVDAFKTTTHTAIAEHGFWPSGTSAHRVPTFSTSNAIKSPFLKPSRRWEPFRSGGWDDQPIAAICCGDPLHGHSHFLQDQGRTKARVRDKDPEPSSPLWERRMPWMTLISGRRPGVSL